MKIEDRTKTVKYHIDLSGLGLILLTITFVVLKSLGHIDWKWLWVFSPLWIPASIAIVVILFVLVIARKFMY